MLTKMSKLELVGYLMATVHSISSSSGLNYFIVKNDSSENIIVIMAKDKESFYFHVMLNHEEFHQHIADVCAKINDIPKLSNHGK